MPLNHNYTIALPRPNTDAPGTPNPGEVRLLQDTNGRPYKVVRLQNAGAATAVAGQPYVYKVTGTAASGFQAIDPLAVATVQREVVFATESTPVGAWGNYAFYGVQNVLVSGGTAVAAGDFLKLAPGTSTTSLIKDGSTQSNSSVAVARAAQAANSNASIEVFLLSGEKVLNT